MVVEHCFLHFHICYFLVFFLLFLSSFIQLCSERTLQAEKQHGGNILIRASTGQGAGGEVEKLEVAFSAELGGISKPPVQLVEPFLVSQGASCLFPPDLPPLSHPALHSPSFYCIACCQSPATHRVMGFQLGTLSTTTLLHIPLLVFTLGLSSLSLNIFRQFCLYLLSLSSQETSVSATKYSYWIITLIRAHDWTLVNSHNYQCCSISEILNPKTPSCPQPATPSSVPRSP